MWEIFIGFMIGDAIGRSRYGRFARLLLKLIFVGLVLAGIIYASLVFFIVGKEY